MEGLLPEELHCCMLLQCCWIPNLRIDCYWVVQIPKLQLCLLPLLAPTLGVLQKKFWVSVDRAESKPFGAKQNKTKKSWVQKRTKQNKTLESLQRKRNKIREPICFLVLMTWPHVIGPLNRHHLKGVLLAPTCPAALHLPRPD